MTKKGSFIEMSVEELEKLAEKFWGSVSLARVRVIDEKNGRWTDCWLSAFVKRGRVVFQLSHEKGYPSQGLGTISKSIVAHWLSDKLPEA